MERVKIQIPCRDDRVKCLMELARRGRIECLPEDTFVVPEPALEWLQSRNVRFTNLGHDPFDTDP